MLVIGVIQRVEAPHDVGRLAHDQPEIAQFQRDVFEPQQRRRFGLMPRDDVGAHVEVRDRNPPLDAALHFEQLELHVDRVGEFGLPFLQRAKLDRFA